MHVCFLNELYARLCLNVQEADPVQRVQCLNDVKVVVAHAPVSYMNRFLGLYASKYCV